MTNCYLELKLKLTDGGRVKVYLIRQVEMGHTFMVVKFLQKPVISLTSEAAHMAGERVYSFRCKELKLSMAR
jgi:hypothetical protein